SIARAEESQQGGEESARVHRIGIRRRVPTVIGPSTIWKRVAIGGSAIRIGVSLIRPSVVPVPVGIPAVIVVIFIRRSIIAIAVFRPAVVMVFGHGSRWNGE